mmetsp:Transcript_37491/g.89547  ORF Transcript_37491/g.89547 Transcript_37491/m.89547 type:complete len:261 (+) Transcript_37491:365-1147(+)
MISRGGSIGIVDEAPLLHVLLFGAAVVHLLVAQPAGDVSSREAIDELGDLNAGIVRLPRPRLCDQLLLLLLRQASLLFLLGLLRIDHVEDLLQHVIVDIVTQGVAARLELGEGDLAAAILVQLLEDISQLCWLLTLRRRLILELLDELHELAHGLRGSGGASEHLLGDDRRLLSTVKKPTDELSVGDAVIAVGVHDLVDLVHIGVLQAHPAECAPQLVCAECAITVGVELVEERLKALLLRPFLQRGHLTSRCRDRVALL